MNEITSKQNFFHVIVWFNRNRLLVCRISSHQYSISTDWPPQRCCRECTFANIQTRWIICIRIWDLFERKLLRNLNVSPFFIWNCLLNEIYTIYHYRACTQVNHHRKSKKHFHIFFPTHSNPPGVLFCMVGVLVSRLLTLKCF